MVFTLIVRQILIINPAWQPKNQTGLTDENNLTPTLHFSHNRYINFM